MSRLRSHIIHETYNQLMIRWKIYIIDAITAALQSSGTNPVSLLINSSAYETALDITRKARIDEHTYKLYIMYTEANRRYKNGNDAVDTYEQARWICAVTLELYIYSFIAKEPLPECGANPTKCGVKYLYNSMSSLLMRLRGNLTLSLIELNTLYEKMLEIEDTPFGIDKESCVAAAAWLLEAADGDLE